MKIPVFDRNKFQLCHVPAPSGYPQSQTHVGVFPVGNLIMLTSSPYPHIKRLKGVSYIRAALRKASFGFLCKEIRGEYYENPCLYCSNDGTYFRLMQSRPLMEAPDAYYGLPAYNSDPDLYVENDSIYVLNRAIYRTKLTPGKHRDEYEIRMYLIKGLLDNGRFKFISTYLFKETTDLIVSPCLTKYRNEYIYMNLRTNSYNDGESFDGLRYLKATDINDLSHKENWFEVYVNTDTWIPWHMSIFQYKDILYSIVACVERGKSHRCWQMIGVFNECLTEMKIFERPLTDYQSYRGSAYVDKDGIFVMYSTTVYEKLTGGKSVDGREVIRTSMPFEELLKKLNMQ